MEALNQMAIPICRHFYLLPPLTEAWRLALGIILFGLAYGVTAKIGLNYSTLASNVTLLWPPSGIGLFVLLRYGYRLWPGIVLGDLIANSSTGAPLLSILGIAAGNLLETIICAWLLRRYSRLPVSFEHVRDADAAVGAGIFMPDRGLAAHGTPLAHSCGMARAGKLAVAAFFPQPPLSIQSCKQAFIPFRWQIRPTSPDLTD
jgi:integral membrane sensor domain MASE1